MKNWIWVAGVKAMILSSELAVWVAEILSIAQSTPVVTSGWIQALPGRSIAHPSTPGSTDKTRLDRPIVLLQ